MIDRNTKKITQIADSIHGTIQISSFEKEIISTQGFNRLHNVLQNSTVFLTYPSNQTKRFVHSLGVMHLGGLIFFHSILNADDEVRTSFFEKVREEIINISQDKNFIKLLKTSVGDGYIELLEDTENLWIDEPLFRAYTPYLIKKENLFAYQMVYQSIRCAALLHDVGHPPFSHITEFALKDVWQKIDKISEEKRTDRQQRFLKELNYFSDEDAALHEQIGNRISDRLVESIVHSQFKPQNAIDAKQQIFYRFVHRFLVNMMEEGGPLFRDLHRIIDYSIDCDRLDYVTRDLVNSGLNYGKIEYDRLISSMKLVCGQDEFLFCPDVRTLSTIEDFFHRRWVLYKHVIYHHRVIKTDTLLEKAISFLAMDYLNKAEPKEIEEHHQSGVLPLDISGLWYAAKDVLSDKKYFDSLIQWDDSWLLTVLRQIFFQRRDDRESITMHQLEELLSNRKNYRSVIKRVDDFLEIDKASVQEFNIDWAVIEDAVGENWHVLVERIQEIASEYGQTQIPAHGFFLTKVEEFLEAMNLDDSKFKSVVEEAIHQVAQQYQVKDSLIVFRKVGTGLERMPYLHRNSDTVLLNEISRIKTDLRQNQIVFPTFFVYVFEEEEIKDIRQFRRDIGCKVAKGLEDLLKRMFASP